MCVIVWKDSKVKLTLDNLVDITKTNPDGLGIAWKCDKSTWQIEKYLHFDKKQLKALVKKLKGKEAVIHARIATSGGVNMKNTHPFVGKKYTLFHNGVIGSLNGILEGYSDTNLLHILLEKCNYNQAIEMLTHLAKEEASKFVLINNSTGEMRKFGNFSTYEGLECSNLNFTYRYDWFSKGNTYNNYSYYDDYEPYEFTGNKATEPVKSLPEEIEDRLWKEYGLSAGEIELIVDELNDYGAEPTWSNVKSIVEMWYPEDVYNAQ